MQMHRQSELRNVLKDLEKLRGVKQHVGNIRKDLKARESELAGTAIDLRNRSPIVSKAHVAKSDELAWMFSNDPRQIVVDADGPLVCIAAADHVRSKKEGRDLELRYRFSDRPCRAASDPCRRS